MYSSQVPSLIHNSISVSKLLHIEMSTEYYVLHIIIKYIQPIISRLSKIFD